MTVKTSVITITI